MPWGGEEKSALQNPKNKLRERRRQRELTKGNAKMDRFEGLEEYIRKDTKQEQQQESVAESSIDEDENAIWKESEGDTADLEPIGHGETRAAGAGAILAVPVAQHADGAGVAAAELEAQAVDLRVEEHVLVHRVLPPRGSHRTVEAIVRRDERL